MNRALANFWKVNVLKYQTPYLHCPSRKIVCGTATFLWFFESWSTWRIVAQILLQLRIGSTNKVELVYYRRILDQLQSAPLLFTTEARRGRECTHASMVLSLYIPHCKLATHNHTSRKSPYVTTLKLATNYRFRERSSNLASRFEIISLRPRLVMRFRNAKSVSWKG